MNDLRTLPAFTVTETPEGVLIAKTRTATKLALCAYPGMDGALCEALWHWAQLYANGLAAALRDYCAFFLKALRAAD